MADERERWALILGASSGMGQATGLALARAGSAWRDRLEPLAHGWDANGAADPIKGR